MSFSAYNPIPSHRKRDLEPSNPRVDNLASNRFAQIRQAKPISKHETRAFSRKSSLIARVVRSYCASCIELPPLSLSISRMLYRTLVGRSRIREDCVFATSKCVYPRYRLTHARTCSTRRSTTRCPLASQPPSRIGRHDTPTPRHGSSLFYRGHVVRL